MLDNKLPLYTNTRFQEDLTSYVLALLTEDEAPAPSPASSRSPSPRAGAGAGGAEGWSPGGPAPARDLQLYADCELAVLAAPRARYDAHARLVRREYSQLSRIAYSELRLKVTISGREPQLYSFQVVQLSVRRCANLDTFCCRPGTPSRGTAVAVSCGGDRTQPPVATTGHW